MQHVVPSNPCREQQFIDGTLVVRLRGDSLDCEALVSENPPQSVDASLHIGHMSLCPYDPILHQVCREADLSRIVDECTVNALSPTIFSVSLLPCSQLVTTTYKWFAMKDTPPAQLLPWSQPVTIKELFGFTDFVLFWP